MDLAPDIDKLKIQTIIKRSTGDNMTNTTDQPLSHQDFSDDVVPFQIIGTGGAGKVAAIRFAKNHPGSKIITIDTSGVDVSIPEVKAYRIKDLNGSGKVRKGNVEAIRNFIADFTETSKFDTVNIVIMSYSGGSGSVIGPLIVDEILRQGKIAIVFGIVDTDSEIDVINGFNCLRTLDNIVVSRKAYLPLVLFDNNFGRVEVDNGVDTMLDYLDEILSTPYIGLDIRDRTTFLSPNVFDDIETGIKMLSLSKQQEGGWEESLGLVIPDNEHAKIDASIIISKDGTYPKLTRRCAVSFRGHYIDNGEDIIASIGYQIPDTYIKGLNAGIHAFKSTKNTTKTEIKSEYSIGETTNGGLVL